MASSGHGISLTFDLLVEAVQRHLGWLPSRKVNTCALCFEPEFLTSGESGECTIIRL